MQPRNRAAIRIAVKAEVAEFEYESGGGPGWLRTSDQPIMSRPL